MENTSKWSYFDGIIEKRPLFDVLTVNRKPFKPVYGHGLTGLNRFGPLRLIDHPTLIIAEVRALSLLST